MKFQFSWQQVAVIGIVAAVIVPLAITNKLNSLGAILTALAAVGGLAGKSFIDHDGGGK